MACLDPALLSTEGITTLMALQEAKADKESLDEGTSSDKGTSWVEWIVDNFSHLKLYHVAEGTVIAFLIPITYLKMQKISKKKTLVKIWKSKREQLNSMPKDSLNSMDDVLRNISFELSKVENQVAEVSSVIDYLKYAKMVIYLNELIDNISGKTFVTNWLKDELDKLILANKFP